MIRQTCVLAAVIGLFLQGSEGGHLLLVEHARCAEHGELVHGTDPHPHDVVAAAEADHPTLDPGPELGDESAHSHCSHASERRDGAPNVPASEVSASRSVEFDVASHEELVKATSARLYRTAPKNSPPA